MRTSALAIAACCVVANAFPSIARQVAEQNAKRQSIPAATPFPSIGGIPRPKGSVPFIEEQQFVSTSGEHRVSPIACLPFSPSFPPLLHAIPENRTFPLSSSFFDLPRFVASTALQPSLNPLTRSLSPSQPIATSVQLADFYFFFSQFIAPTATDQRGPCPGLNAAANHGYLPRDGIATFESINTGTSKLVRFVFLQFLTISLLAGLFEAFGLGRDSTQFLQQTTAFFDGDILASKWSIGTFSTKTYFGGGVLSSLGQQSGICK